MLDKAVTSWTETKVWRELALSLISLNEKTATTYDFPQSAFADSEVAVMSCGRAASNAMVLQDPRVSSTHFSICVRRIPAPKGSSAQSGELELELVDESSNGTWVNDNVVGKGNRVPISTGDRIFVLPQAHVGATSIIGFVVVALEALSQKLQPQKENDGGQIGNQNNGGGAEAAKQLVSIVQCRLCEDALIHRCVTTVPCGHNFCIGCMIDWCRAKRTLECPSCKHAVRQLVRNHSVDSIVETFIRAHPEAARPPESLERLNAIESDQQNEQIICRLLNTAAPSQAKAPQAAPRPQQQAVQQPQRVLRNTQDGGRLQQQQQAQRERPQQQQERRSSQVASSICVIS
jgi:hypothetical protein